MQKKIIFPKALALLVLIGALAASQRTLENPTQEKPMVPMALLNRVP